MMIRRGEGEAGVLGKLGRHESAGELNRQASLVEVCRLIEAESDFQGWTRESSRLFAIDIAMLVARGSFDQFEKEDRDTLVGALSEARRLVVDDRDGELEWVLLAPEPHLHRSTARSRSAWLTGLNALIPCPYRASVATCHAGLIANPEGADHLCSVLRQRLRARLDEGALLVSVTLAV
jgi:hypothetical protein